jgi:protein gp37
VADRSRISWTEASWPWLNGCQVASPGCDNCYAVPLAHRFAHSPNPKVAARFAGLVEKTDEGLAWTGDVRVNEAGILTPLSWREPRRIFVASQADPFHPKVPIETLAKVFAVMAATPRHTYQLLTKRHAVMRSLLLSTRFRRAITRELVTDPAFSSAPDWTDGRGNLRWPLLNVWPGVSVEDQQRADLRIPYLLDTPGVVRWVSAEPLLGPLDLTPYLDGSYPGGERLAWVIVGGESGPKARPMEEEWADDLRRQCAENEIAFHFKQPGRHLAARWGIKGAGHDPEQWPKPWPQEYPTVEVAL